MCAIQAQNSSFYSMILLFLNENVLRFFYWRMMTSNDKTCIKIEIYVWNPLYPDEVSHSNLCWRNYNFFFFYTNKFVIKIKWFLFYLFLFIRWMNKVFFSSLSLFSIFILMSMIASKEKCFQVQLIQFKTILFLLSIKYSIGRKIWY